MTFAILLALTPFIVPSVLAIKAWINPPPTSTPTPSPTPDPRYQVYEYAKQFVDRALKAPSTAKYPSASKWEFGKTAAGYWTASAYVDSENSFGAMIRSDFYIEMELSDGGHTAKPVYFSFDGEVVYDLRP